MEIDKIPLLENNNEDLSDYSERPLRAQILCSGTNDLALKKYVYDRVGDCFSAILLDGGDKKCTYGCIGLGSCVSVCNEKAIRIVNGIAAVEYEKCNGCGECIKVCPKNLIRLVADDVKYWVGCSSCDSSNETCENCKVGCNGCGYCENVCPSNAIKVENNLALIDYSLCTSCGECVQVCVRRVIWTAVEDKKAD